MEILTRHQKLIKKRRDLIRELFADGFLMWEIGKIFRIKENRVSQILKKKK